MTQWTVIRGPLIAEDIRNAAEEVAKQYGLTVGSNGDRAIRLTRPCRAAPAAILRWQPLPPQPPRTLGFQLSTPAALEVLVDSGPDGKEAADALRERLTAAALPYARDELDGIVNSMPLVRQYSDPDPAFDGWALLFRDYYLEHSVGFLLGMERAGIPARWIFALDKGDRTHNRDRVRATFLSRGYRSDLMDNTAINNPAEHRRELARIGAEIDAYIDTAHADGRRVLVVDDGGLLARGYGAADADRRIDAAIELTVSGIKRIKAVEPLGVPVLNMARSLAKTLLGYREIADSCVRRLRAIVPDRKFIGRQVVLLGYGTLGSRIAPALRTLGCRVDVVDTDLQILIDAAEAGYRTHRTAAEALHAVEPFLVIGTTGELALTEEDLWLLPDGVLLAPFATRDFSVLTEGSAAGTAVEVPGVGFHFALSGGRSATLLGNGRSMNLFEADSIPNQGYDAYRAGTVIAAKYLCANLDQVPIGLHVGPANRAVERSGLFDAYYERYLAQRPRPSSRSHVPGGTEVRDRTVYSACVVGYGVAGRLHTKVLSAAGTTVSIIDPKHQDLPKVHRTFPHEVSELPASIASTFDLWSICSPTSEHLPVLRAVLAHNPRARVLLEKPACQSHEIGDFAELLNRHPEARVMVNDQYRHSRSVPVFAELIDRLEPDASIDHLAVTFTKDRTADIARGRFVDRTYGVLGYEWVHMLALLRGVLPSGVMGRYLAGDPAESELWATYDSRLFVAALTERTIVDRDSDGPLRLELASSILGTSVLVGDVPQPGPTWRQGIRPADDRHRHLTVRAGRTRFALHLEPVTTPAGWQLNRNYHRLTATRRGRLLHDEVLHDSPLDTSIRYALGALFADAAPPAPDLEPLRRIAGLAEKLRAFAPERSRSMPAVA